MSEVAIRKARLMDVSGLTSLLYGYLAFYKRPIPPEERIKEMITHLVHHPEEGFQLVAEEDGRLLGFTTVNAIWSTTRMQKIALLNDLFIDPQHRRKGIGEALLTSAIQLAKEKGYPLVRLLTAADNSTAQSLYDKTGGNAPGWKVYDYPLE
ncbi:GNAT family N-acetyltransferase [Aneurinibacillus sp. REN35]|uniref:GNAT family N-acetyltransferase n=1 Tax=Aneurinibacillus sp. REN35 TaxID=3237286 RepID=UPI003528BE08